MRIQPLDIEVPKDDPFKNDLLGRRETVQVLTSIVRSIEGPCVLSVDAAWGAGKTTFLKIWAQYLRNEDFPVVEFNAWETDFAEEPFIALSTELAEGLNKECEKYVDDSLKESLKKKVKVVKGKAKDVTRSLIPGIIKAAAVGVSAATGVPLDGDAVAQTLTSLVEEKLNAYEEARKSVKDFKRTLEDMAESLSQSREGRPMVVVIDELDRCRPSYAVELLEVAKHIFAVDHVVFVLGINRSQLAHSVKALYGDEFDALGYLGRFFDLEFRLPEPNRVMYINALLQETGINNQLIERLKATSTSGRNEIGQAEELLREFLIKIDLSLRQVAQAIHRLGLVFSSLRKDQPLLAGMTTVMFILRTMDLDLYQQFVDGEKSDLQVVDGIFEKPGIKSLKGTEAGDLFELMIIMAANEGLEQPADFGPVFSPLLTQYEGMEIKYDDERKSGSETYSEGVKHAAELMRKMRNFNYQLTSSDSQSSDFKEAVERIELLSSVLIELERSSVQFSFSVSEPTTSVNTQGPPEDTS